MGSACGSKEKNQKSSEKAQLTKSPQVGYSSNSLARGLKIVLLGETEVGKSSLAQKYCQDKFFGEYLCTVGAAYFEQYICIDDEKVRFHIWDTGGSERFRSLAPMYYRDAVAAILVFDLTSEKSYEQMEYWLYEIRNKADPNVVVTLVGNKSDLAEEKRAVPFATAREFAKEEDLMYMETSAKMGTCVDELFEYVGRRVLETKRNIPDAQST